MYTRSKVLSISHISVITQFLLFSLFFKKNNFKKKRIVCCDFVEEELDTMIWLMSPEVEATYMQPMSLDTSNTLDSGRDLFWFNVAVLFWFKFGLVHPFIFSLGLAK